MKQTNSTTPTSAIAGFDSYPNSAIVRLPVVMALFGISAATVWRAVRASRIPKPWKISPRVSGWNVGELRAALAGFAKAAGNVQ